MERRHRKPSSKQDSVFKIRQILNVIFIILAIVGCLMYSGLLGGDERTEMQGAIVAVIAIAFKFAECMLRMKRTPPADDADDDEEEE